jgi:hypothetical protein
MATQFDFNLDFNSDFNSGEAYLSPAFLQNVLTRLKGAMPPWFPYVAPIKDAVLTGMANIFADCYSAFMDAKANMRIPTTTGAFLDLTAFDFFGSSFLRQKNQADPAFAAAIVKEIFRERVTRKGIVQAVADATGGQVQAFEPFNIKDCGGYGQGRFYGKAGRYGNYALRGQMFIDVIMPINDIGIALNGYGQKYGGYGISRNVYIYETAQTGFASRLDAFRAVLNTKATGIACYVGFVNTFTPVIPYWL